MVPLVFSKRRLQQIPTCPPSCLLPLLRQTSPTLIPHAPSLSPRASPPHLCSPGSREFLFPRQSHFLAACGTMSFFTASPLKLCGPHPPTNKLLQQFQCSPHFHHQPKLVQSTARGTVLPINLQHCLLPIFTLSKCLLLQFNWLLKRRRYLLFNLLLNKNW